MKIGLGEYRMRNGAVAVVTSLQLSTDALDACFLTPKKVQHAFGRDESGNLMIWNATSGRHSAGAHVKPASRASMAFDIVKISKERKRGNVRRMSKENGAPA